jgi:3-mercaptopyruvate sulfurtransferase SseA
MMEIGFKNVYALKGGWREWKKSKYPTEPKSSVSVQLKNHGAPSDS